MARLPSLRRVLGRLVQVGAGLCILPCAWGDASIALRIGELRVPGGAVLEELSLELRPHAHAASIDVARVRFGEQLLERIRLQCERFELHIDLVSCAGQVTLEATPGGEFSAALELRHDRRSGESALTIEPNGAAAGLRLVARLDDEGLTGRISASDVDLAVLAQRFPGEVALGEGRLTADLGLGAAAGAPAVVDGRLCAADIAFDAAAGSVAAAGLSLCLMLTATLDAGAQAIELSLDGQPTGEVLLGPLYLDLATVAPELALALRHVEGQLQVDGARWREEGVGSARVRGAAELDAPALGDWNVEIEQLSLGPAIERYGATVLEALGVPIEATGDVAGEIVLEAGTLARAGGTLAEVAIADASGSFSLSGLAGVVDYDASGDSADSTVRWSGASVYELPIGPGAARVYVGGGAFQLLDPLRLAILDGELAVQTLNLSTIESGLSVDFEADLSPLSLEPITRSLGWPPLQGQVSGSIPRVRLRDGVVEMGGALTVEVFDGNVVARNLRVERIFGVLPTFAADLGFEGVDLGQMTGAFSFGEITGTLDGRVDGLRLLDWEPVAFDLELGTRVVDERRHRISQRAVDNLTSIGGGPSAVLSQTFLRFFERFDYDRLGIRCRLVNNICRMGGVGAAPNGGYYIVKGAGLPRIDVIGYSTEVDFPQLLRRLEAATASGGASIN